MTKNWNTKDLMKWLTNHPILAPEDVLFLHQTIAEQKACYALATEEAKKEKQLDNLGEGVLVQPLTHNLQSSKAGQENIPICI